MRRLQNSDTADVDVLKVGENHAGANHGQNCRAGALQLALRCFYLLTSLEDVDILNARDMRGATWRNQDR